ncbi:ECF RNA polymerase sigma factor SigR [Dictyobacter formicarum]|uniref:ECF RNA polymerase sigma factor SigR n=1 Tax=Dictyobacter formicarum TaxID=2778368 RepID=A0ABQ3VJK3_9CHLR|nr:ECF RNA polymerase sigma factor SigR [Dictyobacter formicarum]
MLAADLHHYFQQLVLHYQHRLYTFAYRLSASQQNAEDIVQEAFVNAYVSLENYTPERIRTLKLQAWLYRVTLNVYTHSLRRARLHVVPLDITEDSAMLEILGRPEEHPELLFEQMEQRQELASLLAQLPEKYRICITCYYFEHFTYQEIADLLDQPLGTIKSSVSRGIRQLRTLFETTSQQEGRKEKQ